MSKSASKHRRSFSVLAGIMGLALLTACNPALGVGERAPVPPSASLKEATQVIALINSERQRRGLPMLSDNGPLSRAAQDHANDMAAKGYFAHRGKGGSSVGDRVKAEGYTYCLVAENLSKGYPTPELAVQGWMNSEGHSANILTPEFRDIGIGLAPEGLRVAVFGRRC
ncbi:CAP domain-containing protein [Celeribacter litoreus]|uniref:CAP domain-containing protein n=1 Tax=Celeribacter litoreus TaxID=2876714 RepID=UPI001CCA5ECE|nr:CAP domain-containing protein [Celeribacter litoreus]MCA0042948.1 CAP domain-containing protein [Celeribacter litoreus]